MLSGTGHPVKSVCDNDSSFVFCQYVITMVIGQHCPCVCQILHDVLPLIISSHLSLSRENCWGTSDHFATSVLHFYLFSTALWDLADSRPFHSLMLFSHLFFCLPSLLPPFTVPCNMVLARPVECDTCPYHLSVHLFTMFRRSSSVPHFEY